MQPFNRILVPVDFSTQSAQAVRTAADLARRYEASLTLVHVYDPIAYALPEGYVVFAPSQLDKMFAAFEKQLAAAKQNALEAGAPRVDTRLLQGFVTAEIVDFASRAEADLIVMGTHGRRGVSHVVLGSVAERVVRMAPCAVLTVKVAK